MDLSYREGIITGKRKSVSMSANHKSSAEKLDYLEPSPWFSTYELLEYLGISIDELNQKLPLFQEGIHFKKEDEKNPQSQTLWRIDLVDELLCLPIPPLEREAMRNAIRNKITCTQ